ncbi:cysteine hydrolase [bacterium]|nr:cysteine hydrolase [bacterium]
MIIDVQKACDDARYGRRNNPEAEQRIAGLLVFWRAHDLPVLHVKHMSVEPDSPYRPGQPGNDFKPEVLPFEDEDILEKDTNSAFIRTGLEERLRMRGITDIVITGVATNNSVEATVRMSGNLGFRTVVVSDAVFAFEKRDYHGTCRTADEVHAMSLANMQGEYASVMTAAEVMEAAGRGLVGDGE